MEPGSSSGRLLPRAPNPGRALPVQGCGSRTGSLGDARSPGGFWRARRWLVGWASLSRRPHRVGHRVSHLFARPEIEAVSPASPVAAGTVR